MSSNPAESFRIFTSKNILKSFFWVEYCKIKKKLSAGESISIIMYVNAH